MNAEAASVSFLEGFERLPRRRTHRGARTELALLLVRLPLQQSEDDDKRGKTSTGRDMSCSSCHICLGNKHQIFPLETRHFLEKPDLKRHAATKPSPSPHQPITDAPQAM